MMNNFPKTFLHHMNELKVNLADRGDSFEKEIQALFTEHDFIVHPDPMTYSYQHEYKRINGDIDLIAKKGNYLFLGQLKNRLEPMEPKDYRGADKKLTWESIKQFKLNCTLNEILKNFVSVLAYHKRSLISLQFNHLY